MKVKEPKLCPDCPLGKAWISEAVKRIKERQHTREKDEPSNLKICMELRRIMKELRLGSCKHYKNEEITQTTATILVRDKK